MADPSIACSQCDSVSLLRYTLFPTSIGSCAVAWRDGVIVATRLPETSPRLTAARFEAGFEAIEAASEQDAPAPVRHAIDTMTQLLKGALVRFDDIDCDPGPIDAFAAQVYERTRQIPIGETRTYGEIAASIGDRNLAQQVGRALGRNPLPIIVPCHRVIGANGKLTGFSAPGGVKTKLKMLMIEGARFSDQPGLFDGLSG